MLNILPGNVTMEVGETRTLPFEVQSPVYLSGKSCRVKNADVVLVHSDLGDALTVEALCEEEATVPLEVAYQGEQSLGQRRYPGCPPVRRELDTPNRADTPRAREWALGVFTGQLSHRQKRRIFLSSEGGSSPRPCAPAKTTRPIRFIPAV